MERRVPAAKAPAEAAAETAAKVMRFGSRRRSPNLVSQRTARTMHLGFHAQLASRRTARAESGGTQRG